MSEEKVKEAVKFGHRARTALYLILNPNEWKSVEEISEATGLSASSVIQAIYFLTKTFPLLFEKDGKAMRVRFRGILRTE